MRKLLPIILALLGTGAGVGAGIFLMPAQGHEEASIDCPDPGAPVATGAPVAEPEDREYVKLNNQFVVPVVVDGRVGSMVVMSLSVEMSGGNSQLLFDREPKLRDAFLQEMFEHANVGGFDGAFTEARNLAPLREGLLAAAHRVLGSVAIDVLITEIGRQDS